MTQLPASPPRPMAIQAPRALSHGPMHPIHLGGLRAGTRELGTPPLIVERRDQEFVEGLLDDLADPSRHGGLLSSTPASTGGVMRVFQPLQRVFNMLVLEAFCDVPGQPRVDPKQIDSSGFVLRRVQGDKRLAWLKAGTKVLGWDEVDENLDPAHDRRQNAVTLGHPLLDERAPSRVLVRSGGRPRLKGLSEAVSEDLQPLFVAAPDVCKAAGKTILFGTLRVASGELTEVPAAPAVFGSTPQELSQLHEDMVPCLTEGAKRPLLRPANRSFTTEDAMKIATTPIGEVTPPAVPLTRIEYDKVTDQLGPLLRQLNNEFDAFGTGSGALAMQAALRSINVETGGVAVGNAYGFLLEAKAVLMDAVPAARLSIPDHWGAVSAETAKAIFDASLVCLQQQHAKLVGVSGRFDNAGSTVESRFVVRAFVRMKPEHEGCAGRLIWSAYSPQFSVAPWFESSGAPVPVIPLPDLFDRNQLAKVKPTVAFALPPKLASLLRASGEDLMKGKGSTGDGVGLGWICSFSLPIITLCAFIVLNIMLSILNLFMFWLPFVKICIPIPKKE
jgi:hypothetical protein